MSILINLKYKLIKSFITVVLLTITSTFFAQPEENAIVSECIVQLNSEGTLDELLHEIRDVRIKDTLSKKMHIYLLEKKDKSFLKEELAYISQKRNVIAAQYNHEFSFRGFIPNDTYFSQQWNMLNTGQQNGIKGIDINATPAWEINTSPITKTGDTMVVAVVDEFFALNHPDLNFFINHHEIPSNGIDDDGNGFIDDYQGWNAYNNNGNTSGGGGNNHSTGISGIIGAKGNNGAGVAGVVWGLKILPVGASSTQESIVIKGYDYVIEMRKLWNETSGVKGAFIVAVNSSFGVDRGKPANYPIWCALYDTMGKLGIINVAATTNQNINVDLMGDIPTTCPSKWLISVKGHSASNNRYGGYGPENIDIAAPATSVLSTQTNNSYGDQSGTSFACPHVTGAVAAMFAEAPDSFIYDYFLYPDSLSLLIKEWLLNSATVSSTQKNKCTSDGRLNLHHAILHTHNYNFNRCSTSFEVRILPIRCKGENNGTVELSGSGISYQWQDGDSAPFRNNLMPGLYRITATDSMGCTREIVFVMREPDSLYIKQINLIGGSQGNINVLIDAYGGGDTLWYSLDGNTWQQNNIFSIHRNDSITVWVKNESGCVITRNLTLSVVFEDFLYHISEIFPNPVENILTVKLHVLKPEPCSLDISEISGRKVKSIPLLPESGINTISTAVDELQSGVYFIRVSTSSTIKKIVVSR
ncbi:MAG: S8 family serine peptidase [Chitinophagales bacterium]|nr:S8 family peptidase [Chitinophagales bacterium]MDW8272808.1 S8 family serine peptidase [Chitinophagales bacterium]